MDYEVLQEFRYLPYLNIHLDTDRQNIGSDVDATD